MLTGDTGDTGNDRTWFLRVAVTGKWEGLEEEEEGRVEEEEEEGRVEKEERVRVERCGVEEEEEVDAEEEGKFASVT